MSSKSAWAYAAVLSHSDFEDLGVQGGTVVPVELRRRHGGVCQCRAEPHETMHSLEHRATELNVFRTLPAVHVTDGLRDSPNLDLCVHLV